MPTISKLRKSRVKHYDPLNPLLIPPDVRESTDYEREVDELLGIIADIDHYYGSVSDDPVEDRLAGLENWAESVKLQAERVRFAGILELLGSNSLRRD